MSFCDVEEVNESPEPAVGERGVLSMVPLPKSVARGGGAGAALPDGCARTYFVESETSTPEDSRPAPMSAGISSSSLC